MILLIIGVGMLNFLLPAPLNSIMFLLIPKSNSMLRSQYSSFKFHYVSINSRTHISCKRSFFNFKFHYVSINSFASLSFTLSLNPLNSIMFLLILQNNHLTSLAYMPLNSIMFLLIPHVSLGRGPRRIL